MDGWTSPILACYLGIVAIWFCAGKVHRCILEFARYGVLRPQLQLVGNVVLFRVKERHTGAHLASLATDCVKRFGLEDKVNLGVELVRYPQLTFLVVTRCLHGQRRELQHDG